MEAPQEVICNALIAAEPGSGFLARVIDTLQHQQVSMLTPDDVLNSTGPLLLQRVLEFQPERECKGPYDDGYPCAHG